MKQIYKLLVKISMLSIALMLLMLLKNDNINVFLSTKSAEVGTLFLYFMMIAKSLFSIMKKIDNKQDNLLYNFLKENNKYQREQGLIVFNLLLLHSGIETLKYLNNLNVLIYNYLTVIIPVVILLFMELTSFKTFQIKIKSWKKYHTIVWISIPLILLHVILLSTDYLKYILLTIAFFLVSICEIFVNLKKGMKHFKYLVLGVVISIGQYYSFVLYNNYQKANALKEIENTNTPDTSTDMDTNNDTTTDTSSGNTDTSSGNTDTSSGNTDTNATNSNLTYNSGTYTGSAYGHRSLIEVKVTIKDDDITDVVVTSENEDEPWWQPVESTLPQEVIDNDSTEGISYIAGSTHSSEGFLEAVDQALENAKTQN